MKQGLILTVAGLSTRFNKDLDTPCLKCLYHHGDHNNSLLGKLLQFSPQFDKIFIVGGYKFEKLKEYVDKYHGDKDIQLVFNPDYKTLGSLESLRLGLKAAEQSDIKQLVFAEGDLFLDKETFTKIVHTHADIITTNSDPITAEKTVALYITTDNQIRYIYDTAHKSFAIHTPFRAIHNSAQVWKFIRLDELYKINNSLTKDTRQGTNLLLIEEYYRGATKQPQIIRFNSWINCNTTKDYDRAYKKNFKEW